MSRDAYSYDPQDTRDTPASGSARRPTTRQSQSPRTQPIEPPLAREIGAQESPENSREHAENSDGRRAYYDRDRAYLLRNSELQTLADIGTFRVVAAADLTKHGYADDRSRMERDVQDLKKQSLVADKNIEISGKKTLRVLSLTKTGKRLLKETNRLPEEQAIYHGLVKPREAKHDADLYRLYQKEAARIRNGGGTPVRVVLDYELKANLNRDLASLEGGRENTDARARVAEKHGLTVVEGKIPLPDLRIEYQDANLQSQHIDLELATHHYRPRGVAEKAKAGFSLYSPSEDAPRLRRILNDRELTAKIFAL